MLVYRLSRTIYAKDLKGEGARLFGGRWNNVGTSCLYASETRALCVLEFTAHLNPDDLPPSLSIIVLELPPKSWEIWKVESLPKKWMDLTSVAVTQAFGNTWLEEAKHLAVKVPSAIIPEEFNVLINPGHPDMSKVKVVDILPFSIDHRLMKPAKT